MTMIYESTKNQPVTETLPLPDLALAAEVTAPAVEVDPALGNEPAVEERVTPVSAPGEGDLPLDLWAWVREVVETLLLAMVIFMVINTFTGRYEVQSVSMEPTLHEGQYLIVSRVSYWFHQPERGDIVVLDPPYEGSEIPYIKRVVGLPGDRVAVENGRIWVNGTALNEPYISGPISYSKEWTVPDKMYVVLGDNRNNSSDSHVWGELPRENILGKAVFRYWPLDKVGAIAHYTFPELENTP